MTECRLTEVDRQILRKMGFSYGVMINKDVSVISPGAVISVFQNRKDVDNEVARLNHIYSFELESHVRIVL